MKNNINILKLGLVAGRHEMPVDGYVLESVTDVTDVENIRKAVFASLSEKLEGHIRVTEYGPSINGVEEDSRHYQSDVELHLYVTGLTEVALEVVRFCGINGVPLVAYHFNRATGEYFPQRIFG